MELTEYQRNQISTYAVEQCKKRCPGMSRVSTLHRIEEIESDVKVGWRAGQAAANVRWCQTFYWSNGILVALGVVAYLIWKHG